MSRRALLVLTTLVSACAPAAAMVGNAPAADPALARHLVMIVGSHGNFCTGAVLASDLVLTAAHCVPPGADYKLIERGGGATPRFVDVTRIVRHPQFAMEAYLAHRATADVALLKLARALDPGLVPAPLAAPPRPVVPGDRLVVAGYGLAVPGDGRSGGTARGAGLTVTGIPGSLQIRLFDPATRGREAGPRRLHGRFRGARVRRRRHPPGGRRRRELDHRAKPVGGMRRAHRADAAHPLYGLDRPGRTPAGLPAALRKAQ